jgi:hypothetical protein
MQSLFEAYPEEYDEGGVGAGAGAAGSGGEDGELFPFGKQKGKSFIEVFGTSVCPVFVQCLLVQFVLSSLSSFCCVQFVYLSSCCFTFVCLID